jgi:hypothetical protein
MLSRSTSTSATCGERRRAAATAAHHPIAGALGIGFQQYIGIRQDQPLDHDLAGEERQQFDFGRQPVKLEHGRFRAPIGIAEGHLAHGQCRGEGDAELDIPGQHQVAPGCGLHLAGNDVLIGVEIGRLDDGDQCHRQANRQHHQAGQNRFQPHRALPPMIRGDFSGWRKGFANSR